MQLIVFFFFNDTATTEIYTLSLHDALPIFTSFRSTYVDSPAKIVGPWPASLGCTTNSYSSINPSSASAGASFTRSEEHTSELQSQSNLVCRLLLEKKKCACRPIDDGASEEG